jgi:hypothetical protein
MLRQKIDAGNWYRYSKAPQRRGTFIFVPHPILTMDLKVLDEFDGVGVTRC